jgi:ribosomal protein S5
MKYIEEIISFYGVAVKDAINPAKQNLFEVKKNENKLNAKERARFHSVVVKLLYLGK